MLETAPSGRRFAFQPSSPQEQIMAKLDTAIVGVAGYTGAELVRIIHGHPELELVRAFGSSTRGQRLGQALPSVRGVAGLADRVIEDLAEVPSAELSKLDVAFTALPHAESARVGATLLRAGVQVVDLSADYRLSDVATYEQWYGQHPEPELLKQARYGLVEWHREELAGARLIAAPGCYPTSAVLPLGPLLAEKLVEPSGLIIDAKSGVSGAGKKPLASTHFSETSEGIRPYKVARKHRHTPEIEQELGRIAGLPLSVLFTPQLAPFTRGILSCCYARALPGTSVEACRDAARKYYDGTLVSVLEGDELPDTLWVRGSARAQVAYALEKQTGWVIAFAAIDNLTKGASGQAVQALNVARGFPEELGLPLVAQFP
jgi:N-acetyl-gamma-glutamyl-phosphate reductase